MAWSQRLALFYPIAGLPVVAANAIVSSLAGGGLETAAHEAEMWTKARPESDDWGATDTHRRINCALTPALAAEMVTALEAAAPLVGVTWMVLDAESEAVLHTNDTGRTVLDWAAGIAVTAGQRWRYRGVWYEVIQAHTTQADWTPDIVPALFKPYLPPGEAWPWRQPQGAHDAYPVGARVTFGGDTWINTIPANVWQPGVTGWTNLTPPPVTPNWVYPHHYIGDNTAGAGNGDVVLYVPNGHTYRCIQTHDSIVTWTPVAVPALWLLLD